VQAHPGLHSHLGAQPSANATQLKLRSRPLLLGFPSAVDGPSGL